MSFDDFLKKKEQSDTSLDKVSDKLLAYFLPVFEEEDKQYYLNKVLDAKTLTDKEMYKKYAQDNDLYHFLTNFVYKGDLEIQKRIKEKVEINKEYVTSAFKSKLKVVLDKLSNSKVVDVNVGLHSKVSNTANVKFLMDNDEQIIIPLKVKTHRNEKGRLFLNKID